MAAEEEGAEQHDRRERRRSNWIQAICAVGFVGLVLLLDWVLNDRMTYLGAVALGIAIGLAFHAVRYARRRYSDRR